MAIYSEFTHLMCDFPELCKRLPEGKSLVQPNDPSFSPVFPQMRMIGSLVDSLCISSLIQVHKWAAWCQSYHSFFHHSWMWRMRLKNSSFTTSGCPGIGSHIQPSPPSPSRREHGSCECCGLTSWCPCCHRCEVVSLLTQTSTCCSTSLVIFSWFHGNLGIIHSYGFGKWPVTLPNSAAAWLFQDFMVIYSVGNHGDIF